MTMQISNQENTNAILNALNNAQTTCANLYAAWSSSELFFEDFPHASPAILSSESDLAEKTISLLEEINEYTFIQFSKLEILIQALASSAGYEYDHLEGVIREKQNYLK